MDDDNDDLEQWMRSIDLKIDLLFQKYGMVLTSNACLEEEMQGIRKIASDMIKAHKFSEEKVLSYIRYHEERDRHNDFTEAVRDVLLKILDDLSMSVRKISHIQYKD